MLMWGNLHPPVACVKADVETRDTGLDITPTDVVRCSVYRNKNMVTLPHVTSPAPPAARLRAAIESSPYSVRSLAKAIAARPDIALAEDTVRRTINKKLAGREAIGDQWAALLENQLGLEAGYLHEQDFSRALSLAAQIVRRLDAGERLPSDTLLELAAATEEAASAARRFAGRLRREAQILV
jgi:hypothetical protein